ncbi:hypothetical protein LTR85_001574 [Meristemomyces frigidus]|nr:hypothetical protein LTR85_001574 [Meristemomyces frigidus]
MPRPSTAYGPSFLDLPAELRQCIFALAVKQQGSIELQHPVWAGQDVFAQPLFQVSRLVRNEALQAFYETSHFLWIIDPSAAHRSDPADYQSMKHDGTASGCASPVEVSGVLTPARPWNYPHLRKHLRHLNLNVYLPSNLIADATAAQAWFVDLPQSLRRLVEALDRGRRLAELQVLFTAKRINTRIGLAGEQLKAVNVLSEMEVRGTVKIQTRYDFKELRSSILNLGLERRMKA